MSLGKKEFEAVKRVMNRGVLSGYKGNWGEDFYGGLEVRALEKEWCEHFGVKHAIACNSATSGLWMACSAIGLKSGDEVIVTPYSMCCSATIPLHFRAKPIFADIEPDYFCLNPESVEKAVTERTKAIIAVDLFGQPADYDAINAIAKYYSEKYGHKIYVIEDAAQAIGAKYSGKYAGTIGDMGIYSLNVHKHIQCGEGGVVVTDNDELAFKLRLAVNHGESVINDISRDINNDLTVELPIFLLEKADDFCLFVGLNLRMTELQAAIAREQLKKLEKILQEVRKHAKHFPVKIRSECEHAFYRYAFKQSELQDVKILQDEPHKFNLKRGYVTPIYRIPLFKHLGYRGELPVCEKTEENIVLVWSVEIFQI